METLEVVARPQFHKSELAWLTDIRRRRTGNPGPPKFTLVFSGAQMPPKDFAELIAAQVKGVAPIRFHLRCALVAPEPAVGGFHVFLIPDEGFAAITRLHDRLHVGPIEAALRPEMPYLPHITVTTDHDYAAARKTAESINARDLSITGVIDTLQVERRRGGVVRVVAEIPLEKAGWFG